LIPYLTSSTRLKRVTLEDVKRVIVSHVWPNFHAINNVRLTFSNHI
jgi:hypothetical protein